MNGGTFYSVGVGPGDPELLTRKAERILRECPVIAAPQTRDGRMLALEIAQQAVDLSGKTVVPLSFPMSPEPERRVRAHRAAADSLRPYLDAGTPVAMLNLGDPTIYATASYVRELLAASGYETVIIPGVPSFCAAAAALGLTLVEGDETLTIRPGPEPRGPESRVLMKSGRHLPEVLAALAQDGSLSRTALAANVGLPGEQLLRDLSPEEDLSGTGYFATLIIPPERGEEEDG